MLKLNSPHDTKNTINSSQFFRCADLTDDDRGRVDRHDVHSSSIDIVMGLYVQVNKLILNFSLTKKLNLTYDGHSKVFRGHVFWGQWKGDGS